MPLIALFFWVVFAGIIGGAILLVLAIFLAAVWGIILGLIDAFKIGYRKLKDG